MKKYYFTSCTLPKLSLGVKPDISFEEVERLLEVNLSKRDKGVLKTFKGYIDIKNLKSLFLNRELDPRGNMDKKEIGEAFLVENFFPFFVFEFLKKYKEEERAKNFYLILSSFLNYQMALSKNDFLRFYFKLERDMRIIFSALRAFELNRDITKELEFEDKTDPLVEFIFSQKGEKSLEVPKEYEELKTIFLKNREDPKNLNFEFLNYRFQKINERSEKYFFDISSILGYLATLIIVEDYFKLDKMQGKLIMNSLLE
jgi:hypothetical protein